MKTREMLNDWIIPKSPQLSPDMIGMITDGKFFVAAFAALTMSILHFQPNTKKLTSIIKEHEPSPPLLVLSQEHYCYYCSDRWFQKHHPTQ